MFELFPRPRPISSLTDLASPRQETYHLALQNLRHHGVPLVAHGAEFGDRDDAVVEGAEFGDAPVVVHCFRLALCDVEREATGDANIGGVGLKGHDAGAKDDWGNAGHVFVW